MSRSLLRQLQSPACALLVASLIAGCVVGCHGPLGLSSPERSEAGYMLFLTGIEGTNFLHHRVVGALQEANVPMEVEIHDWTTGSTFRFHEHLADLERNRAQAELVAEKIVIYQDLHPQRPIYLFGHSGGAGIALLSLEALPEEYRVTKTILLAACASPRYDLRRPIERCEEGLWSFYSRGDRLMLDVGTRMFGTIDRDYGPSAGAVGFTSPDVPGFDPTYGGKLHQIEYQWEMLGDGHFGGHEGWLHPKFVRQWLVPLLTQDESAGFASAGGEASLHSVPIAAEPFERLSQAATPFPTGPSSEVGTDSTAVLPAAIVERLPPPTESERARVWR